MSETSEAPEAEKPPIETKWYEAEQVERTPTHYIIKVLRPYQESQDPVQRAIDQTEEGCPDEIRIRRKCYGGDLLCLDTLPRDKDGEAMDGKMSRNFQFAERLSGVRRSTLERMDWDDYCFVYQAVEDVTTGKG